MYATVWCGPHTVANETVVVHTYPSDIEVIYLPAYVDSHFSYFGKGGLCDPISKVFYLDAACTTPVSYTTALGWSFEGSG